MTSIVVIAGSNRAEAQSHRIGALMRAKLDATPGVDADLVSLRDLDLPLWDESKRAKDKADDSPWTTVWAEVSGRLKAAQGFVVVTPEWHGMASPHLKNFLLCCEARELAFKPAYLVAVSGGAGGAYPIAELRMSGYKNSFIQWLPDHLIIRDVGGFRPGEEEHTAPEWLERRMDHGLRLLGAYAEALTPIRENSVDFELLRTGM